MKLRSSIHAPRRYGEDDPEEYVRRPPHLPRRTVPFNPNLPEAAFPTLEWPVPPKNEMKESEQQAKDSIDAMDLDHESRSEMEAQPTIERHQPAPRGTASLPALTEPLDRSQPGEFERNEFDDLNDMEPLKCLTAYDHVLEWHMLSDGMKLLILVEMTEKEDFEDVMEVLQLRNKDLDYIARLQQRERQREQAENERIARTHARQLEMLSRGGTITHEAFSGTLEEDLFVDTTDPSWYRNSKDAIDLAYQFLQTIGQSEIAERIKDYHGVDYRSYVLDFEIPASSFQSGQPMLQPPLNRQEIVDNSLNNQEEANELGTSSRNLATSLNEMGITQSVTPPVDDEKSDPNFEDVTPKKRKYTRRTTPKEDKQTPSRRSTPARGSSNRRGTLKLRAPSGLRNSISADDFEAEPAAPSSSPVTLCQEASPTADLLSRRRGRPKKQTSQLEDSSSPDTVEAPADATAAASSEAPSDDRSGNNREPA